MNLFEQSSSYYSDFHPDCSQDFRYDCLGTAIRNSPSSQLLFACGYRVITIGGSLRHYGSREGGMDYRCRAPDFEVGPDKFECCRLLTLCRDSPHLNLASCEGTAAFSQEKQIAAV